MEEQPYTPLKEEKNVTFSASTKDLSDEPEESSSECNRTSLENGKSWYQWCIIFTIFNALFLMFTLCINYLSTAGIGYVFVSTHGRQSAKYNLDISPAGQTYCILCMVYVYQGMWSCYAMANLFRKTARGKPVFRSPVLITPATFMFYIGANQCNIFWLFLFDRDYVDSAFLAPLIQTISLMIALLHSYRTLDSVTPSLAAQGRVIEIWVMRLLVNNGLAIYATWSFFTFLFSLAIALSYSPMCIGIDVSAAGTVVLGILTVSMAMYISNDLFFHDRYSRYTFTPYVVVVVVLTDIIFRNWTPCADNFIISAALLAFAVLAFVMKVTFTFIRQKTHPDFIYVQTAMPGGSTAVDPAGYAMLSDQRAEADVHLNA